MNSLKSYLNILQQINKRTAIQFSVRHGADFLCINNIEFHVTHAKDLLKLEELGKKGILVPALSNDQIAHCKSNDISFLTAKGQLLLVGRNYRLVYEPKVSRKPSSRVRPQKTRSALPLPTVLISPNGFNILDVLFRSSDEELASFRSVLSFAREYGLNQSKLSLMMTGLGVKRLAELKQSIRKLPDAWWGSGLSYPMTRKGLTSFFEAAKPYYSIQSNLSQVDIQAALQELMLLKIDLVSGPVEVMRELGLIRDDDIYLWGSQSAFQELKKTFQLIPGRDSKKIIWNLAVPAAGMTRESILSPMISHGKKRIAPTMRPNLFRAVWDLTFGGERLKEIQISAVRKILDEL